MIGFYCPDKWENTSRKRDSYGDAGWKEIVSGKPFLFYCLNNQIQIIKHREDQSPSMASDKEYLMMLTSGIRINANKAEISHGFAHKNFFVHP